MYNVVSDGEHNFHLPALLFRAGQRLLDARNSAEVLEARNLAQAALHYARVTKAANDTHADCLRIITRAEMRMANEIDHGQQAGELAPPHRQGKASEVPTLSDMGIRRDQLHEWRELRDAGEEAVESAIAEALGEGRAPTRAGIQVHVRGTLGTGEVEWYTPAEFIEAARDVLGDIDLDPASSVKEQQTVKAKRFFTKDDDGLMYPWSGRVWLNPPYAQPSMTHFVEKMVQEVRAERVQTAIMLTHNYTDTNWFHFALYAAAAVCFTKGRIRFADADGGLASPTQGQAFFYLGQDTTRFTERFADIGFVVKPCRGWQRRRRALRLLSGG